MYIVMLGNPKLGMGAPKTEKDQQGQTRFKRWWLLVGSALSHAAKLVVAHQVELARREEKLPDHVMPATEVDFAQLFREVEADDEDTTDLIDVLTALEKEFSADGKQTDTFLAKDIAAKIAAPVTDAAQIIRSFFTPSGKAAPPVITPKMVGFRIASILDTPVEVRDERQIPDGADQGAAATRIRTIKLTRAQAPNQKEQHRVATFRVVTIGEVVYQKTASAKGQDDAKGGVAKGPNGAKGQEYTDEGFPGW